MPFSPDAQNNAMILVIGSRFGLQQIMLIMITGASDPAFAHHLNR